MAQATGFNRRVTVAKETVLSWLLPDGREKLAEIYRGPSARKRLVCRSPGYFEFASKQYLQRAEDRIPDEQCVQTA